MSRTLRAAATAAVCMLVLAACWEPEDATHVSSDGETSGLVDPNSNCIYVFEPNGERKVLFEKDGGNILDCEDDGPVAPTTTVATTTPGTTTPPTTTIPDDNQGETFLAAFNDGDDDLNTLFDRGLWRRDDNVVSDTTWTGDHDLDCGSPATQRTIDRANPDDVFYQCRNHMMTAEGDTSGYSIAWFSPKQTFNGQTEVSVDVNSTNLGIRQWFEFSLVPADYNSGVEGCESCIAGHTAISNFFPFQPDNTLVWGQQLGGQRPMVNNIDLDGPKLCNSGASSIDVEGCASKPIRRTWTMIDNLDGTVTMSLPELGYERTVDGSFPTGDWKLVIKDHNYTPNKACDDPGEPGGTGICPGYTWHYDNITVT